MAMGGDLERRRLRPGNGGCWDDGDVETRCGELTLLLRGWRFARVAAVTDVSRDSATRRVSPWPLFAAAPGLFRGSASQRVWHKLFCARYLILRAFLTGSAAAWFSGVAHRARGIKIQLLADKDDLLARNCRFFAAT